MLGNVEAMAQLLRWGHLLGVWGWAAAAPVAACWVAAVGWDPELSG